MACIRIGSPDRSYGRERNAYFNGLSRMATISSTISRTDESCYRSVGLPKTRSGKIMRRVLRKIATKEEKELGDLSTLADPEVVKVLLGESAFLSIQSTCLHSVVNHRSPIHIIPHRDLFASYNTSCYTEMFLVQNTPLHMFKSQLYGANIDGEACNECIH